MAAIDLPPGWEAAAAALAADGVTLVWEVRIAVKAPSAAMCWVWPRPPKSRLLLSTGIWANLTWVLQPPWASTSTRLTSLMSPGLFPDALYFIGQTSPSRQAAGTGGRFAPPSRSSQQPRLPPDHRQYQRFYRRTCSPAPENGQSRNSGTPSLPRAATTTRNWSPS